MASTDPKTATQGQWEDLASRVQSKAEIGTVLSTPSSTVFVQTANIADGAITTDKIAGTAVTASNIDFSTLGGNYSTTEQDTGYTWIDGKTIYKKTVNFGTLPDATTKNVAHGISNISYIVRIEGIASNSTRWLPLPVATPSSVQNNIILSADSTNVIVTTGIDRTSDSAYVTLYYTKN